MTDAFQGVLIDLELREFDRMCAMRLVISALTKSCFGKNQSYEVLTSDRMCGKKKIKISPF